MPKLSEPRRRVLKLLVQRGGQASPYDLAYPRSHMMHNLQMDGLIGTMGTLNAWGEPAYPTGKYTITEAGRRAIQAQEESR